MKKNLFLEQDKIAFEEGQSEVEETITFPNDSVQTLLTKKVRFSKADNDFILGLARDITDIKDVEAALTQANFELEEFAYRTSHDLRSPLVSSIALLDRAKSTHMEEETTTINVSDIIEETLLKLSNLENYDRLDIHQNLSLQSSPKTQKTRFELIIENLISNAIKYQDLDEPQPYIKIEAFENEDAYIFEIHDNGIGIPQDQEHKLFQMFQRYHSKKSFGSGLGLYMVKKSAEIIGGKIAYERAEKGSIFRLLFPK